MKKIFLSFSLFSLSLFAKEEPSSPSQWTQKDESSLFCLGPITHMSNAPLKPYTCNGDYSLSFSALYCRLLSCACVCVCLNELHLLVLRVCTFSSPPFLQLDLPSQLNPRPPHRWPNPPLELQMICSSMKPELLFPSTTEKNSKDRMI